VTELMGVAVEMLKAKLVDGEVRCGGVTHRKHDCKDIECRCPGRFGRLFDGGRGITSTRLWQLDTGPGWIFTGWQAGEDWSGTGFVPIGGRWKVTSTVQGRYDRLKRLGRQRPLLPGEERAFLQGPRALAQRQRKPPREIHPTEEEVPVGLYISSEGSRLPTLVVCYHCGLENVVEAPETAEGSSEHPL
jgi:hypothetical protein